MAKQLTIKEIALRSGVSPGTVDRIIHGRGRVSEDSRQKVEDVLAQVGYRSNLHTSAVSLKKSFRIAVCIPASSPGEYWSSIEKGFAKALEEYSDINVIYHKITYDQFDVFSCRNQYDALLRLAPDAVILGPTFENETRQLCAELDRRGTPYVFVDSAIDGTAPIAAYTTDQSAGGYLLGKLLGSMAPEGDIALFLAERIGGAESHNSSSRQEGFEDFIRQSGRKLILGNFSMLDLSDNERTVKRFLEQNPGIKGLCVLNSRAHIVSDALDAIGRKDILLGGFDLTYNNIRCMRSGRIDLLLCQRPEMQGFRSVQSILNYLLYRKDEDRISTTMPIDIVIRENLDFYRESF